MGIKEQYKIIWDFLSQINTFIRSNGFMKKILVIVSIITVIMCDIYVCYANDMKIEVTCTDADMES